jgi:ubiquinone/menaquinone biosynthesis C-methylase UbiE
VSAQYAALNFRQFFDSIALHYEERIIPAFAPFASDLITWLAPQATDTLLDIGTGTGVAARYAAPQVQTVLAIDFAPTMVQVAHETTAELPNLYAIQGDAHALPLAAAGLDVVTSSFGFNATHPRRVFAEVLRVLHPGGRFAFQEWGKMHQFDKYIVEALEVYAVYDEDAPPSLVALRDFLEQERPWHRFLQTTLDYVEELTAAGFVAVDVFEHQPVQLQISVQDFMRYKLAWTSRLAELNAMDKFARADCLDKMRALLQPHADSDGLLTYDPHLFRVQCRKPR